MKKYKFLSLLLLFLIAASCETAETAEEYELYESSIHKDSISDACKKGKCK